jgi:beta-N-acetylhexosaminidase
VIPLVWLNRARVGVERIRSVQAEVQIRRILSSLILVILLSGLFQPMTSVNAEPIIPPNVTALYDQLTPEERIGQLFLVTFTGSEVTPDSQIYDLIANHHIGGVVLSAANDNFTVAPNTVLDAHRLIDTLQKVEWDTTFNLITDPVTGEEKRQGYVPLFIGITQEGDGYPTDELLKGLTPLPSEMAIGATWDPELAAQVGSTLGRELSLLGVNLFLGPSLDVLESPNLQAGGDLGTRVFGGDPYWVGQMGSAYISGLHVGSENRLLVVAKHFPGSGGTDRLPEEEVATVRKSLEQLKQIELAPFFAVTGNALSAEATVDALLVSHIRYQGFQGNIRATTRPVSFDAQALSDILNLQQFASWHTDGGLIVSDDLGSRAVRQFYAPGGQTFSARVVTRDAFLAGNDMLYLGQIISSDVPDNYTSILQILDFFSQKYQEDPAFADRVDAAAIRILTRKFNLYGNLFYSRVIVPAEKLNEIGNSEQVTFDVARRAATLISPDPKEFSTLLPSAPQSREQLVLLTDAALAKQCSQCPEQPIFAVDALQQAILRLYGPQGGNQTSSSQLTSYSFDNLQVLLDGLDTSFLESDLGRADWVVISLTDNRRGQQKLISRFLTERQDLLRNKQVVLFSFGAPYYFDATDLSKLTAYFGLYSKQLPFADVAARLLYQELAPIGASPVSISGVGYDLITALTPDPNRIIPLSLDFTTDTATPGLSTPEPTPIPLFKIGDTIALRAGLIYDHNGNPVPDGTVVRFAMILTGEGGGILQQVDTVTTGGIGRASFGLDKPGLLEIRVTSEPAVISEVLQLDVSSTGSVAITVVVPVLSETVSPTPTPVGERIENGDEFVTIDGYPRFGAWFVVILMLAGAATLGYWSGMRLYGPHAGLRWALGIVLGGLSAYTYLALGLLGATNWTASNGLNGIIVLSFMGILSGWAFGWWWARRI